MPVTIGGGLPFCGRQLTSSEWELIQEITRDFSGLGLTELAGTICELLEWERPNGGLKSRECYQFFLSSGLVALAARAAAARPEYSQHNGQRTEGRADAAERFARRVVS